MNQLATIVAVGLLLATPAAFAQDTPAGFSSGKAVDLAKPPPPPEPAGPIAIEDPGVVAPPPGPGFMVVVDPMTGDIKTEGGGFGNAPINPLFTVIGFSCPDCGGTCPPLSRTISLVLQANTVIPGGFGVGNLSLSNYSLAAITGPQKTGLAAGELFTITAVGDVGVCTQNFQLFFDVCDPPPNTPEQACPP